VQSRPFATSTGVTCMTTTPITRTYESFRRRRRNFPRISRNYSTGTSRIFPTPPQTRAHIFIGCLLKRERPFNARLRHVGFRRFGLL
jgi:hypothetical protein